MSKKTDREAVDEQVAELRLLLGTLKDTADRLAIRIEVLADTVMEESGDEGKRG